MSKNTLDQVAIAILFGKATLGHQYSAATPGVGDWRTHISLTIARDLGEYKIPEATEDRVEWRKRLLRILVGLFGEGWQHLESAALELMQMAEEARAAEVAPCGKPAPVSAGAPPDALQLVCELHAGHQGAHSCSLGFWTDTPPAKCRAKPGADFPYQVGECELPSGHRGAHNSAAASWPRDDDA